MKLAYLLAVILGVYAFQAEAQVCPSGQVCPLNFPVRSDGGGMCDTPEGVTVRNEIRQDLSALLTSNSQVLSALRSKYLGLHPDAPAASCAEIYNNNPNALNGYYFMSSSERQYCRFDFNTSGQFDEYGWQRLALTNMTDPLMSCPAPLELVETDGIRFCRKNFDASGCASVFYQPSGSVNRMYGRIYGIQSGTPDIQENERPIDDVYVDGVSLTYGGVGSRQHIWTFFGYTSAAFNDCPCSTSATRTSPSYVGENYFCESGTADNDNFIPVTTYTNDPIWDAQNCELNQVPCCDRGPWFYREFEVPFEDRVELRLCTDDITSDEDVGVQLIDLWFQ